MAGERPVQLLVTTDLPRVVDAVLVGYDGATVTVRTSETVAVGARIIVIEGRTKLLGRCTAVADGVLTADVQWERATDARSSPRVDLPCRVRFAGKDGVVADTESPINVALSGVRFNTTHTPPSVGDRVALWLSFEAPGAEWEAAALTRRVDPDGGTWAVAVEFIDLPDAALEFLSDHTHKPGP